MSLEHKIKIRVYKKTKTVDKLCSQIQEQSHKTGLRKHPKTYYKKVQKTWNCQNLLVVSKALTVYPTKILRPLFDSQFVLSFNFYFGHKTDQGLETWEN